MSRALAIIAIVGLLGVAGAVDKASASAQTRAAYMGTQVALAISIVTGHMIGSLPHPEGTNA